MSTKQIKRGRRAEFALQVNGRTMNPDDFLNEIRSNPEAYSGGENRVKIEALPGTIRKLRPLLDEYIDDKAGVGKEKRNGDPQVLAMGAASLGAMLFIAAVLTAFLVGYNMGYSDGSKVAGAGGTQAETETEGSGDGQGSGTGTGDTGEPGEGDSGKPE